MDFRKDNQKYNNGRQLHIEDYLHENKLETKGNVEVPNIIQYFCDSIYLKIHLVYNYFRLKIEG